MLYTAKHYERKAKIYTTTYYVMGGGLYAYVYVLPSNIYGNNKLTMIDRDKRLVRIYSDIQGRMSILREDLTVIDTTLKKLLANKPIYVQDIKTVRDLLGDDLSERLQTLVVSDDYPYNPNRI
mgnify:CR=1 FL=1